jgi:hypothetical protein
MSLRRDLLALCVPMLSAGVLAFGGFALVQGTNGTPAEQAVWYPNGRLRSVEWRTCLGRDGLCLYWHPDGELDRERSAIYRPVGLPQAIGEQLAADVQPLADLRLQLETRLLRESMQRFAAQHGRMPSDLVELRDAGCLTGSRSVPRDPFGGPWLYTAESPLRPARLESEKAKLVCEFVEGAPACHWRNAP